MITHAMMVMCLSLNIYFEAGSVKEPDVNKYAVAYVTQNRAIERHTNVCREVYRRNQFSWTRTNLDDKYQLLPGKKPYGTEWKKAKAIAKYVIDHPQGDFTSGATYFHATYIKAPKWTRHLDYVATWGRHIFYKEKMQV